MENIQINKTKTINNYDNINCHNYFEKWAFSMSKGVNTYKKINNPLLPNSFLMQSHLGILPKQYIFYICIKD